MPTYTSKTAQPNVVYPVTVTLTRKSATIATCKVSCGTKLASSGSWLGTGHALVGHLWIPGVGDKTWTLKGSKESWSGTATHTTSASWDISVGPEVTSISGFQFKAENTYDTAGDLGWQTAFAVSVGSGVSYTQTEHTEVEVSGSAESQAKATAVLTEIPLNVGYTRVINWYVGDVLKRTDTVTETQHTFALDGLVPNTSYNVSAEIRIGSKTGSVITTKTVAIITPQETGLLTLDPKATYITAKVSDMFDLPNYTRTLEFYLKEDEDSAYKLITKVNEQGKVGQANLTGLVSNAGYDVQVMIKNEGTTLKTLNDSTETTADLSLIPTPDIEGVTQQLGTRLCTLTWITDKSVAGTTYTIEAKAEGENNWTVLETVNEITSPIVVTAHDGNVDVVFRISAKNEDVAEGLINYSNEFAFYVRDDFLWDSDKIAGQPLIITANEWNRLREYALARCEAVGTVPNIPVVRRDEPISAVTYNTMKNAISLVNPIDVADKRRGDAITAADIDALRIAINTVAT